MWISVFANWYGISINLAFTRRTGRICSLARFIWWSSLNCILIFKNLFWKSVITTVINQGYKVRNDRDIYSLTAHEMVIEWWGCANFWILRLSNSILKSLFRFSSIFAFGFFFIFFTRTHLSYCSNITH